MGLPPSRLVLMGRMCTMQTSRYRWMYAMSTLDNSRPARADGYHHGNLGAALVAAGIDLLEQGDNADFSLREAARRVGVTVNACYRHYASKEALMAAIAAEGFRRFATALRAGAEDGNTPRQRLLGSGLAYVAFARRHPALFRLMFGAFTATQHGPEVAEASQQAYAVLKTGIAATLGKEADSQEVSAGALRAWSMAHGISFLVLDGQFNAQPQPVDDIIVQVLSSWE